MKFAAVSALLFLIPVAALAMDPPAAKPLEVKVRGIGDDGFIKSEHAYCIRDENGKPGFSNGKNSSPSISWSSGPAGTKSYALVMVDPDVPADFTDANKEGKTLPAKMKRQNFYHWVVVNIPAAITSIGEGHGKGSPLQDESTKSGLTFTGTPGINDYPSFMKDKPKETFLGYDGSCPPWNDEKIHHYHFKIFALDVETLPLKEGEFDGKQAMEKILPHMLTKGEAVGKYTLNTGKVVE